MHKFIPDRSNEDKMKRFHPKLARGKVEIEPLENLFRDHRQAARGGPIIATGPPLQPPTPGAAAGWTAYRYCRISSFVSHPLYNLILISYCPFYKKQNFILIA